MRRILMQLDYYAMFWDVYFSPLSVFFAACLVWVLHNLFHAWIRALLHHCRIPVEFSTAQRTRPAPTTPPASDWLDAAAVLASRRNHMWPTRVYKHWTGSRGGGKRFFFYFIVRHWILSSRFRISLWYRGKRIKKNKINKQINTIFNCNCIVWIW